MDLLKLEQRSVIKEGYGRKTTYDRMPVVYREHTPSYNQVVLEQMLRITRQRKFKLQLPDVAFSK